MVAVNYRNAVLKHGTTAVDALYAGTTKVYPYPPSYITPSVGVASTPDSADIRITGDTTITARIMIPDLAAASTQFITSHRTTSTTNYDFLWIFFGGNNHFRLSTNGTAATGTTSNGTMTSNISNGQEFWMGAKVDVDNGAGNHTIQGIYSLDGITWLNKTTTTYSGVITSTFDSPAPLQIGRDINGGSFSWQGKIFYVQMETGLTPNAGTVKWRFDANDHLSGTTWTDPRGKVWTLTNASAITHPAMV